MRQTGVLSFVALAVSVCRALVRGFIAGPPAAVDDAGSLRELYPENNKREPYYTKH